MSALKEASYRMFDGRRLIVSYDPAAPCRRCGEPVMDASVGGTDICPWCDMGVYRDWRPRAHWPKAKPMPTETLDLEHLPPGFRIEPADEPAPPA